MLGVLFYNKVVDVVSIVALTMLTIGLSFFFIGKGKVVSLCNSTKSGHTHLYFIMAVFLLFGDCTCSDNMSLWVAFDASCF